MGKVFRECAQNDEMLKCSLFNDESILFLENHLEQFCFYTNTFHETHVFNRNKNKNKYREKNKNCHFTHISLVCSSVLMIVYDRFPLGGLF